jgi:hypothetical protein
MTRIWRLTAVAALAPLVLVACGDDDDAGEAIGDDVEQIADESDVVEVTLDDYEFRGLPDSIPAGTRLTVRNVAEEELHELVAFRLPDDEDRSVEELLSLPPEELMPMLGGEPDAVLLATPGGPQIDAVGDGTLTEPGRYAVACFIPIGVDPDVYLAAAAEAEEGPPQVEGAGPPHFTAGMHAELTVE